MWTRALKRIPTDASIKSVFLFGEDVKLSRAIAKRFPKAETQSGSLPRGIVDLICIASSRRVFSRTDAEDFASQCVEHLAPDGYLLIPAFGGSPDLTAAIFRRLSRQPRRFFQSREVALYRPRGNGTLGDPLPEGYTHYLTTHAYLVRECSAEKSRFEVVDGHGVTGTRWHYGPLWFEKYYGDIEPTPDRHSGPLRMMIWQPLARLDTPKGWKRTRFAERTQQTGFATVTPEYWKTWTSHVQRHRAKWKKLVAAGEWEVVEVTPEEFIAAYRKSKMDPVLKFLFIDLIKEKFPTQGANQHFWGTRRKGSKTIEAGFVANDVPEAKQSKHFISFIQESAKKDPVGTGLMDVWFEHAVKSDLAFLDFGVFWAPGDPGSWKGFSTFKGQFGIFRVRYPYPLVCQAGSWRVLLKKVLGGGGR